MAVFGLSKSQNRRILKNSSFSKIRGTRCYMAPKWVFNLSITSKVDVYSYEIVVLKMVTGKWPSRSVHAIDDGREAEHKRLVTCVREKKMKKVAAMCRRRQRCKTYSEPSRWKLKCFYANKIILNVLVWCNNVWLVPTCGLLNMVCLVAIYIICFLTKA